MKYLICSGVAHEVDSNYLPGSGRDSVTEIFLAAYFYSSSETIIEGAGFGALLTTFGGTWFYWTLIWGSLSWWD